MSLTKWFLLGTFFYSGICLVLCTSGGYATTAGVIMIFAAGPLLGLFTLIAIPLKFRHNIRKNERMVRTVAEWQRLGRLTSDAPFTEAEDLLLLRMERYMIEIDDSHKHPVATGALLAGSMGYGAVQVAKVPGDLRKFMGDR